MVDASLYKNDSNYTLSLEICISNKKVDIMETVVLSVSALVLVVYVTFVFSLAKNNSQKINKTNWNYLFKHNLFYSLRKDFQ